MPLSKSAAMQLAHEFYMVQRLDSDVRAAFTPKDPTTGPAGLYSERDRFARAVISEELAYQRIWSLESTLRRVFGELLGSDDWRTADELRALLDEHYPDDDEPEEPGDDDQPEDHVIDGTPDPLLPES